jgi:hypothetical protein
LVEKTTMLNRLIGAHVQKSINLSKENERTNNSDRTRRKEDNWVTMSQNAGIEKVPPSPKEMSLRGYRNQTILHECLVYAL